MKFLHYKIDAGRDNVIEVTLDRQANVRLLDSSNFSRYRAGQQHRYHGGLAKSSPVRLRPPRHGRWHVVVDLGGYSGRVNAGCRVL